MAFILEIASCVAAGRFNPGIVVPDWIVKQGILPNAEVEISSAMGSGTTSFSMLGLQWRATLARLEVLRQQEGADPGDFVAQVLERLQHTPTRAVGSNFRFSATPPDDNTLFALADSRLLQYLHSDVRVSLGGTAVAEYSYEDAVLRVSLMFERNTVTAVDFNFNRDSLSAVDGAKAARRWASDKAEAHAILNTMVGV